MRPRVILVAAVLGLTGHAAAGSATFEDNAADNGALTVDVVSESHGHATAGTPARQPHWLKRGGARLAEHTVTMREDWSTDLLVNRARDFDHFSIRFRFDLDGRGFTTGGAKVPSSRGSGGMERDLYVRKAEDGSLYGVMLTAGGRFVGFARVWRPDARSLSTAFPRAYVGGAGYRWVTEVYGRTYASMCGAELQPDGSHEDLPPCYDVSDRLHRHKRRG
ncbi:MAG: hypothetical protein ABR613_09350 [Actinomycetota bacterium]